jgi:hypothetical protein
MIDEVELFSKIRGKNLKLGRKIQGEKMTQ